MMTEPLAPGSTIGILGAGQLGRMLAQAAAKIGLRAHLYAPEPDSPGFHVTPWHTCAPYDDKAALGAFADAVDVVTFEFENVPAEAVAFLDKKVHVRPPARALAVAQDRLRERQFLQSLEIPAAPFVAVDRNAPLEVALAGLGEPGGGQPYFLKRRRLGYDGKGQFKIHGREDLEDAKAWLGDGEAIVEHGIAFDFEFSVIAVGGLDGACLFYDPSRNEHVAGTLRKTAVPGGISQQEQRMAQGIVHRIVSELNYVGVVAVEFFALRSTEGQTRILVNEIAPRVHNSGHWTIEACAVSQFENHIRAVAGWPLGDTARHSNVVMVNLLGDEIQRWRELLVENPGRSLHVYGKSSAQAGRKMGHYVDLAPRS